MNQFNVTVYDIIGREHNYYVETSKDKKEVMNDINAAWNNDRSIQINYRDNGKDNIAIFDNKKVIGIDLKEALSIDELIDKMNFKAQVMSVPCEVKEEKKKKMTGKQKLDEIRSKLW